MIHNYEQSFWENDFERKFDIPVYQAEIIAEMGLGDPDWNSMKDFIRSVEIAAHHRGMVEGGEHVLSVLAATDGSYPAARSELERIKGEV